MTDEKIFFLLFYFLYFKKAAYLDPNTITFLSSTEIINVETDLIETFKNKIIPEQQNTQEKEVDKNIVKETKGNFLEAFGKKYGLKCSQLSTPKPADKEIQEELNYFKKEISNNTLDFSNFWKKHATYLPMLASEVRKVCIIAASSVASESSFSEANFIQRKERSSLSSKSLRFSMILKSAMRSSIYKNVNLLTK
jgi:hypothetical protein